LLKSDSLFALFNGALVLKKNKMYTFTKMQFEKKRKIKIRAWFAPVASNATFRASRLERARKKRIARALPAFYSTPRSLRRLVEDAARTSRSGRV